MLERGFLIFLIFFIFFSEFSCPSRVWTEFGSKIFFSLSWPISSHSGQKKCRKVVFFLFFQFFYYFFQNFLSRVEYGRHMGVNVFSLFLGLSHPVLTKNNIGKRIFNYFQFFWYFFGIFLSASSMNGIREWNFFLSFSAYLIPRLG